MRKPKDCLERGVVYQINLRSFTNEGTLNAAARLLPSIREIADIVYILPCFVQDLDEDRSFWSYRMVKSGLGNPANPYRIKDYCNVDPEYGSNGDLKNFVLEAHRLGLKVLLDLVYFHCGPKAVFIEEHPGYVLRREDGSIDTGEWCFPRLNFGSSGLREYLFRNMELFVRDYGIDGFRCDVGDRIPLDFWAEARRRAEAINPNLVMICEGEDPAYLDVFDLLYCRNFRNDCLEVAEGGKPASLIGGRLLEFSQTVLRGGFNSVLYIENHDTVNDDYDVRIEKRLGTKAVDAMLAANYLLPNVPFVYCGTEAADGNRHSIFANRFYSANLTVDWQNLLTEEGKRRKALLKKLHTLRHELEEIGLSGKIEFMDSGNAPVLAFVRGERSRVAVAVNLGGKPAEASVNAGTDSFRTLLESDAAVSLAAGQGRLSISLGAYGFAVAKLD